MLKIKLNPDKELVEEIKARLKETGGYCPCAAFKTEDTKCPCKEFREKDTAGECYCGLYVKENLTNE
jgi:ferredoxin-thioredoxin reductase catalytic subunit